MTPFPEPASPDPAWPEALATVTACRYQFGAGRALAFGAPSGKHFLITFNYEAGDEMHTGQLLSATAMPQGHLFPITYNPERPHENSHGHSTSLLRNPVIAIGVAGSIVLSLLWWLLLHMRGT